VRMRLILALAMTPVAIGLGVLNVSGTLTATAPFVAALVLFAWLNVWEPYGEGDARPWATYMFARSGVLAAAAAAFLVAGARFPIVLAGALECLAITVVMVVFGCASLTTLRLAARARGGAWRAVFSIAGPAFATQSSTAAGTLILSGAGSPSTAGIFAACVRLLTGINAINGIVATALYPRLARFAGEGSEGDRHLVAVALSLIALICVSATAVCALFGGPIAVAFLGHSSRADTTALVLTMAAALPLGNTVMFVYQMFARGHERAALTPFALGAPATIALGILAVSIAGARVDFVGASLLIGQLTTMAALGIRVRARCPDVASVAGRSMVMALLVVLLAGASLLPRGALPAGLILVAVAAMLLARLWPTAMSLLADIRRGRTTSSVDV
jgi:O-antigen/teichoic acid export membrane protein